VFRGGRHDREGQDLQRRPQQRCQRIALRLQWHGLLFLLSCAVPLAFPAGAAESRKKNILFIGIDDMRVQAGCYGQTIMKTPHMDRLAAKGMVFMNAYVQQAVCAASRASLLTGCRPDTTGVDYPYTAWFKNTFIKDHLTIPVFFANKGYYTRTLGKIHHGPKDKGLSEDHFNPADDSFWPPHKDRRLSTKETWRGKVKPFGHPDLPDHEFQDGQICDEAVAIMKRAVASGKPFFIAPGFKKPHLPFVCPKKYYDLYDHDEIDLSPHPKLDASQDAITVRRYGATRWFTYKKTGISRADARELRHHYYACVSYIDAQVGRLLDTLDELGVADNTIVMLWSDHGFHLGDHGIWTKQTNYELATRSPLIVYDPGMRGGGRRTTALVEYVDMYPTLLELSGLKPPDYLEGTSFAPVLDDPSREWKKAAFSQFPRGKNIEGYSVRTAEWRYTEWRSRQSGKPMHVELYHTAADPIETINLAKDNRHAGQRGKMRTVLEAGWKRALPPGVTNNSNNPPGKGKKW
jgi:arylsulfatase A-like enzyme